MLLPCPLDTATVIIFSARCHRADEAGYTAAAAAMERQSWKDDAAARAWQQGQP